MRFLIKVAYWLTIVVLYLPADSAQQNQAAQVGPIEALGAAQAAVEDASGFCTRNPDACIVGSQAFMFNQELRFPLLNHLTIGFPFGDLDLR